MIRKLLATTALVTFVASGAYAQTATQPAPAAPATENAAPAAPVVKADGSLATNIVGESVYNGTGDDAESIGKVSDIVFDKDGTAKSMVIGVGGFLGVGTKNVAFDYDKLKWAEKNGDRWLVAETSKEALTALPEFDKTPYEPAPAPADTAMAPSGGGGAMAPAGDATQTAPGGDAQTMPAEPPAKEADMSQGMLASSVLGEDVYNGMESNAEKIGSVNDIVLSKEGKAEQYVIGVGGFLGVGQKNVAFDLGKTSWAEKNGDRWMVVQASKEELQGLPDFDRKAYDPAPASSAAASDAPAAVTPTTTTADSGTADSGTAGEKPADTAMAPATTDQAQAPADAAKSGTDATETAAIDKSTLTEVPADKISADNLMGTTVYGANDAKVGEIGDVVLSADNRVDAVIVDVGGFLGIGSKPVAIGMDKLKFLADKDGNQYLYTDFTKDQLEAQAAYDKGSYADKRDEQRMIIQ
ncbi:PRC-barrel domain-containing protein [Mesorhizobium sp. CN5-321]|jgi:sporulation protein YlmC with PRC-barrel domain|uniref:PRC-barrel domain-containing protein n=1 Tax=Mesorhizobium hunchu TaxID=3157708 RepID=UPI0032B7F263